MLYSMVIQFGKISQHSSTCGFNKIAIMSHMSCSSRAAFGAYMLVVLALDTIGCTIYCTAYPCDAALVIVTH